MRPDPVTADGPVAAGPRLEDLGARSTWSAYVAQWGLLHNGYDITAAAPLVRVWMRMGYWLGRGAAAARLGPLAITVLGVGLSAGVPMCARNGGGWPVLAAALVLAAAVADSVDSAVAVVTGRASRLGYVYDGMADRVGEACWLVGFAVLGAPAWLVGSCAAISWLHEYGRARATAVGYAEVGITTVGERPTRILIAIFGMVFAGMGGVVGPELATGTVTTACAMWLVLSGAAIVQLLAAIRGALG